jgi:hypothetical protein
MGDMAHKVSVCARRVQWVEGVSKQWGTRDGWGRGRWRMSAHNI